MNSFKIENAPSWKYAKSSWEEAKKLVLSYIGENSYKNWISKLNIERIDSGEVLLVAKTNFIRDVINSRYSRTILKAFNSIGEEVSTVNIRVEEDSKLPSNGVSVIGKDSNESHSGDEDDQCQDGSSDPMEYQQSFDSKFTFDTFVVGKPNEFAYAASMSVAEATKVTFNPLFLYGGVGLGKTHLIHAIAWKIKKLSSSRKVVYLSAEKFMYLFIKSLRFKSSMSFKEHFRNVDVLMIDDVQFIGGKEATQEEFFHTFNDLVDNNRQVILSADKSPSDLDGVEERLKSRLGWGLVADIHPSTYELRLGILQSKVKAFEKIVPDKVLEFLASKITSNIRELEGALNRVIAHSTLVGREVTIEMTQEILKDLLKANERLVTIENIQKKVCEYYGIKFSDLLSSKRHRSIARVRQVAMYLSKHLTSKSLPEIGRSFGGKDHATVIHAVKKVDELISSDSEFAADVDVLKRSCSSPGNIIR
jgi:chromosomal replication initiator protein